MQIPISSITPFTMQDYPNHTACILWFMGCNFRCDYCHNPELVFARGNKINYEKIKDFLISRQNLLDGVVFSGGECTIFPKLADLIEEVKNMGFLVKLDSNGSNPKIIQNLIDKQLIDYIALDYKAPKSKFYQITKYKNFDKFAETLAIICNSNIDCEIRTTIHIDLLDEEDINQIIKDLEDRGFNRNLYLQNFVDNNTTLLPLAKQSRKIDLNKINTPKGFKMYLRNFI